MGGQQGDGRRRQAEARDGSHERPRTDTSAEATRVLTELYRKMTPAEKLERVRDLTLASCQIALTGLRARHPGDTRSALLLRLARIRLGSRIAAAAYGAGAAGDGA